MKDLTKQNKKYWQSYKPGEIPSIPQDVPQKLLASITGPVLDVGVGDGKMAEEISEKGLDVYGIDIAENIIAENKKRKSKVIYSVEDIAQKTNFSDNFFDVILFKFTLTNIHKESWQSVNNEIHRILKPGGKVWVLEPMVSTSYNKRYKLAKNFIDDKHCVYVFHDKNLAEKIQTKEDLTRAIKNNEVSRIIKHYTIAELKEVFSKLKLADYRTINVVSPSGFAIETFEGVFEKK